MGIPWWLWLGLDAFTAKGQGSTSLVGELRSCKASGMTKKKKKFLRVLIVLLYSRIHYWWKVSHQTNPCFSLEIFSIFSQNDIFWNVSMVLRWGFYFPFCCPENLVGLFSWWDVLIWSLCWEAVLCCLTIFLLCFFLWLLLIRCWSFQIGSVYHLSYLTYLKILIFLWVIFFSQTVNCIFNFSNHIFKNGKILL